MVAINGSNPTRKYGPERDCYLCRTNVEAPNSRHALQPRDQRQQEQADNQEDEQKAKPTTEGGE